MGYKIAGLPLIQQIHCNVVCLKKEREGTKEINCGMYNF